MSNFQQPGIGGDKFEAAAHNGHLLLFFPTQLDQNIPTVNGTADAVTTRIVDLDTGQVLDDAKVWGKAMVPQLKGAIPDGMILGRLAQGQSKGGNNPPWILQPHTEQDVYRAEQWLAANPRGRFAQPQAQQAPPTQNGYGAPATQQGGWGQQPSAPASPQAATGGWGAPQNNAPQAGWGAPAPAAQSAPPAPQNGYGAAPAYGAPAADQGQFPGQWGNAAPPAQQAPQIDPGLVAALQSRGVDPSQLTSQAQAEGLAAAMGLTRG